MERTFDEQHNVQIMRFGNGQKLLHPLQDGTLVAKVAYAKLPIPSKVIIPIFIMSSTVETDTYRIEAHLLDELEMPFQLLRYRFLAPSFHITDGVVLHTRRNKETPVLRFLKGNDVVEHHRKKSIPVQFKSVVFHVDEVCLRRVNVRIFLTGEQQQC